MSNEGSGFVPVNTGLVLETLVERMFGLIEGRRDEGPPEAAAAVLAADLALTALAEGHEELESDLRHAGYLARVVEVELFEPARRPAEWIPPMLSERFASSPSWDEAVAGACAELARSEPLGKPSPDDEAAMTWRVPGPGGHVRHYLARRTIEDYLRDAYASVAEDPAELKRPWLYGFFVRSCEEALPAGATLGGED
ncbi:MAG: hypothetical protein M3433_00180 [Actinomycetota bacterium]|nr:hypothetical protein [Actinomycetota bacterium]MDQ3647006.1 hypothetical protein [Actinomycetota bacterium]